MLVSLLFALSLIAVLSLISAKPHPGIEDHIAEAAEETFEVLDPPRIRDSSEQFHQAVDSHNLTVRMTPAERRKVLASQSVLIQSRTPLPPLDGRQHQPDISSPPFRAL